MRACSSFAIADRRFGRRAAHTTASAGAMLLCEHCDGEPIEEFARSAMLSSLHAVSCRLSPERFCKRWTASGTDELGQRVCRQR